MNIGEVPDDKRAAWTETLLRLVQSRSKAFAGRASLTLFYWSRSGGRADILPALVSLYPVPDESASRNIVAAVVASLGESSLEELDRQLVAWQLPEDTMSVLRKAHEEYRNTQNQLQRMIMQSPSLAYIPNLSEGIAGYPPIAHFDVGRH